MSFINYMKQIVTYVAMFTLFASLSAPPHKQMTRDL